MILKIKKTKQNTPQQKKRTKGEVHPQESDVIIALTYLNSTI